MTQPNQYQVKELRGALDALAVNDYHRHYAASISRDVEEVMQLIEAEASRRARAAEERLLDELESLSKHFTDDGLTIDNFIAAKRQALKGEELSTDSAI